MISVLAPVGDVAMLRLEGRKLGGLGFESALAAVQGALATGARAILLDVASARTLRASDIARLMELSAAALPLARLALVNAQPSLISLARDHAIDQVLPIYATLERALAAQEVRACLLSKTPAVVLCAGKGTRMAPLTQMRPKPMLDIMGRPILEHILRHLRSFGIRDVVLNPGHLGPQITQHFGPGHGLHQSIQYLNEGRRREARWVAAPLGSAATLARWVEENNGLASDTVVMCGDALVDVDLAAMMACHRERGADITIAAQNVRPDQVGKYGILVADDAGRVSHFQEKPRRDEARSTLANTGIYIVSPRVAEHLSRREGADIAGDLLPAILASGGKLQVFDQPFQWVDIGNGRDYVAAWRAALAGKVNGLWPDALEPMAGVWAHPSAEVARLSDIEGPAYIGPGARVARGASLQGPVVMGRGAIAEKGSLLRDSIIMAHTRAGAGAWVDGMIAGPAWAVAHAYADGSNQPWDPLDGVSSTQATPEAKVHVTRRFERGVANLLQPAMVKAG
ncbi:MAG: NDP-sugar synthase [Pseudomonadota bacterium]